MMPTVWSQIVFHFCCLGCMLFLVFGFASATVELLVATQSSEEIVRRSGLWLAIGSGVALLVSIVVERSTLPTCKAARRERRRLNAKWGGQNNT